MQYSECRSKMNTSEPQEIQIAQKMRDVYPPVLLIVGIPGNILSLIVLARIKNSQTSPFLVCLAAVDLFVLCVSLMWNWIGSLEKTDFRNESNAVCKLHIFAVYSSLQISSWILVLITTERVCSVTYPFRVRELYTRGRALVCILVMMVCILGLNTHFLFGYHLEFRQHVNRSLCISKEDFEFFEFKVWPWLDFLMFFMIPGLILIFGNIFIIHKLRTNRRFSANSVRHSSTSDARTDASSFFTKMTLTLNTVFFICISPVSILSIGQPYWWPPDSMTYQDFANLDLAWTCVTMLMYINNCVNFLLYIISGSKFRRELRHVFMPRWFKSWQFSKTRKSSYTSTRESDNQTIALNSLSGTLQR